MRKLCIFFVILMCSACSLNHGKPIATLHYSKVEQLRDTGIYQVYFTSDVAILGLFIAFYSRDACGRVLATLVVALFFAHVFESIGMCVLLMPITGIPLPLVSYSGTFVVICMFMLGLVQSVWIHRNTKPALVVEAPAD